MQLDKEKQFKGSFHCMRELVKKHSFPILLTGYWINNIREIAFCSVYFGMYEHGKHVVSQLLRGEPISFTTPLHSPPSSVAILIAGGMSGASAWAASFPLDVMKSNFQGQELTSQRKSIFTIISEIWKSRGIRGFYAGIGNIILLR